MYNLDFLIFPLLLSFGGCRQILFLLLHRLEAQDEFEFQSKCLIIILENKDSLRYKFRNVQIPYSMLIRRQHEKVATKGNNSIPKKYRDYKFMENDVFLIIDQFTSSSPQRQNLIKFYHAIDGNDDHCCQNRFRNVKKGRHKEA